MGRSTPSARQSIDSLVSEIEEMKRIMRKGDSSIVDDIIRYGKTNSAGVTYSTIDPDTGFIISVLVEVVKRISMLEEQIK